MDVRTSIRCLVKGTAPESLVRIDQLLHTKHRNGYPVRDINGDVKFNEIKGTWFVTARGTTTVGTYSSGSNDFGEYYLYGNVCHCRFRITGLLTGLGASEMNLISIPFPAILPPLNGNNVPLTIGSGGNANDEYRVQLENTIPSGFAIYEPANGNRLFDDYGHFWYFVNL